MLTERIIRDALPDENQYILWDDKVKGLGLRVAKGGTKTFVLDYRIGKKHRRSTLARASEISLESARERAGLELLRHFHPNLETGKQILEIPCELPAVGSFRLLRR